MNMMKQTRVLLMGWLMCGFLQAAPGDLDTTFDGDGKVNTASTGGGQQVIQQADGKLAVGLNCGVARYHPDGTLDTSFNGSGVVMVMVGIHSTQCHGLVQQQDGKLVIAGGSVSDISNDYTVVRFNVDGSLDTGFNGTGIKVTDLTGGSDIVRSIIQQADGKLVVAGIAQGVDFGVVRYNADGSVHAQWTTNIGPFSTQDDALSVIQQADGKLVVAGKSESSFALVRYNADTSLDTTFNGTGKVTTSFGTGGSAIGYSVIQQQDGKLVVAGVTYKSGGTDGDIALARYNADGSLDTGFDGDGKLTTPVLVDDLAYSVVQQADGKLVVAGHTGDGSSDFALVRYNPDGSLDTGFNGTGKLVIPMGLGGDYARSLIQQQDGKLVAAGRGKFTAWNGPDEVAMVRIDSGQVDTDGDGIVDWLDNDNDADAVTNTLDNCSQIANPGQQNLDGDSFGDACDPDVDGDLVLDSLDHDDDNDGIPDAVDSEPLNPAVTTEIVLPLDNAYRGSGVQEGVH